LEHLYDIGYVDYLHLWTDVTRMYNLYTYCVSRMFVFDVDLMMMMMMMTMKTYYVYSMFYVKLSSVDVAINNFIYSLCTQRGTINIEYSGKDKHYI
jgi:hypothetical protein